LARVLCWVVPLRSKVMQDVSLELTRGGISLAVTLIGLGVGWLVGQRLTYQWNLRQKRRESELATAHDLRRLYGEFFAIWKVWNVVAREADPTTCHDVLCRAAEAEGLLERVLVKLATERRLSSADRDTLGKFRQAYQQLRGAIKRGQPLGWNSSEHPEYLAFKRLAVAVTLIVQREGGVTLIGAEEAFASLRDITSNGHEKSWSAECRPEPAVAAGRPRE
jgi:hypothetical protein